MSSSLATGYATIRVALKELIEGTTGEVRTVESGAFKYLEMAGFPLEKLQQRARDTGFGRNWFHVKYLTARRNASSPASELSNLKVVDLTGRIDIVRFVLHRSTIVDGVVDEACDAMLAELDDVTEALQYPLNLEQTEASVSTQIVGGGMDLGEPTPIQEIALNLEAHILSTSIPFSMIVQVTRTI